MDSSSQKGNGLDPHKPVQNVVIVVAMQQEAEPFIESHQLVENIPSPFEPGSPMLSYSGKLKNNPRLSINLVWNGRCQIHNVNHVASTAAAISTYAAIAHFHPDLVISAGTAGGFAELGACIGDVYLSTKCVFHGRRIPVSLKNNGNRTYLEEYGFGHFRSPALPLLVKKVHIKQGVVSTSDSLDSTEMDLQLLRSEGAVAKEMEAASVAWVCQQLHVPFVALKAITDIVDGPHRTEDEFYRNLELSSAALQLKLSLFLENLAGTSLLSWNYGSGAVINSKSGNAHSANGRSLEESHNYDLRCDFTPGTAPVPELSRNTPIGSSSPTGVNVFAGFMHGLLIGGICVAIVASIWSRRR